MSDEQVQSVPVDEVVTELAEECALMAGSFVDHSTRAFTARTPLRAMQRASSQLELFGCLKMTSAGTSSM